MLPLNTENENIEAQYKAIVKAIIREIKVKNIPVIQFCTDTGLDVDEFLDSLNEIKADFSYYLEVLEVLKDY